MIVNGGRFYRGLWSLMLRIAFTMVATDRRKSIGPLLFYHHTVTLRQLRYEMSYRNALEKEKKEHRDEFRNLINVSGQFSRRYTRLDGR